MNGESGLPKIDQEYLTEVLVELLTIPSPSGRTDHAIQVVGDRAKELGFHGIVTRRGALRLDWHASGSVETHSIVSGSALAGRDTSAEVPRRALIAHVDTLGAAVKELKPNGRLALVPIGTYSPRNIEGARVTIFTDDLEVPPLTGTVLPLKASGHRYNREIDEQPVAFSNLEIRVDEEVSDAADLASLGLRVGDFVGIDAEPVVTPSGFVKARHLDDKAGVAALLAGLKAMRDENLEPSVDAQILITISEEVGHGASNGLDDDIAELVVIDNAVVAPGQQSREDIVTLATQDLHGPFDYHLTRHLDALAVANDIPACRDIFDWYRSDAAAALEAGMATRAALIGFGVDASHGYERTHLRGLHHVAQLVVAYLCSDLTFTRWDREPTGPLEEFPSTAVQPADGLPPR